MRAKVTIIGYYELDPKHYPKGLSHEDMVEIDQKNFREDMLIELIEVLESSGDYKINVEVDDKS